MFSVTLPPTTSATVPSCSETTIATASVSSVTPMAARWRVPQVFLKFGFGAQRQQTANRRDSAPLDHQRAIMNRRMGLKNAFH